MSALRPLTFDRRQGLALDAIPAHELRQQEGTQHVVLLLGVEANLSGRTLGGIGHLLLSISRRVAEQVTLRQHTRSHGSAGVADLADVRLLGEAIDAEISVSVTARLAVDLFYRILENNFLILFAHNVIIFKWVNKTVCLRLRQVSSLISSHLFRMHIAIIYDDERQDNDCFVANKG